MRSCGNREPSANMTGVATKRMPCEDGGRGQGASTCQGPQQGVLGQVPPHTSVWAPGSTPERTGSVLKPPSCGAWLWLPEPRLKPRKGGMEGADEGPGTREQGASPRTLPPSRASASGPIPGCRKCRQGGTRGPSAGWEALSQLFPVLVSTGVQDSTGWELRPLVAQGWVLKLKQALYVSWKLALSWPRQVFLCD